MIIYKKKKKKKKYISDMMISLYFDNIVIF